MLSVDWTTPAIVCTVCGVILIWFRTWKIRYEKKSATKTNTSYDEQLLRKIYNRTIDLLNEENYYLNKNLKVSDLASRLNQNDKLVSKAINTFGNGNFNTFINSFRVEHAKNLLSGGEHDHYTIEAIADEAGFANKVSFYNAFKSVTGMSPKEFKAQKQS